MSSRRVPRVRDLNESKMKTETNESNHLVSRRVFIGEGLCHVCE